MDDRIFKDLPVTKLNFHQILKIHEIFLKSANIVLFLFYNVYEEKMYTIEIEDRREEL